MPGSPIAFVRRYHSAYPIVGIGHWGPFFYLCEAVWMLLFGWSRTAVLLLSASVTIATAVLLYGAMVRRFGVVLAGLAAVACVMSPLVQPATASIMIDGSIALLCLLAMLAYRRYIETGHGLFSVLYGLLATAGLLIKGNAACLVLLPVFVVLIGGHWHLLRRVSFWYPALVTLPLAGPWYYLTYRQTAAGFRYHWGWDFISVAVPANAEFLLTAFGPLALIAGLMGSAIVFSNRTIRAEDSLMVTATSLLVSVLVVQSVVPAAVQSRYLIAALPPLMIAAAYALQRMAGLFSGRAPFMPAIGAAMVLLTALPWALEITPKREFGLTEAAHQIWAHRLPDNPSVLIAADGAAEGAAIAELAMEDTSRPSLFAIRGSRLLGGGGYNTSEYQPRFGSPQEVMAAIDDYKIPFVIVRGITDGNEWRHIDQVNQARLMSPERWDLIYRDEHGAVPVALYRLRGNDRAKADIGRIIDLNAPRNLSGW